MSDPSPTSSTRFVHASLGERDGQPWIDPGPDFVDRVMAGLEERAAHDSLPARVIRPGARRIAVAAGVLAAITLAVAMRLGPAASPPPSASHAALGDLLELPTGMAASVGPEVLLAREWAAVVHDTRAMLEVVSWRVGVPK